MEVSNFETAQPKPLLAHRRPKHSMTNKAKVNPSAGITEWAQVFVSRRYQLDVARKCIIYFVRNIAHLLRFFVLCHAAFCVFMLETVVIIRSIIS